MDSIVGHYSDSTIASLISCDSYLYLLIKLDHVHETHAMIVVPSTLTELRGFKGVYISKLIMPGG